jgi:hypothetical protein
MRQKVVSVLPIVKGKTQREQSPWKTKVALWYLVWPKVYTKPEEREKLSQLSRTWFENVLMLRE